ncbi:Chs5p ASCRUDRAFT_74354 [Ascoidea rubescens DSM 1968]|uniref:BRCT domain-containing protein n=1 Tax=Ascoidea rubescens DSM 1968 TaxID=1344418 RepID=A0A1D2VMV5_9ASCO|nr:hypothetical protein ASCRUDRAFT_74354 [Ascoidea rubescens DSM 1968]ODV62897.1 hypothetical protein ASCRUDRAFT_74354 [Ascoidea rubescens DSM 1968]
MVEVSLTVGKLDASLALLLTSDHHLIEFPTILLPEGVQAGSIIKIKCDKNLELEKREKDIFFRIQEQILNEFGRNGPKPPILKIRNITQTSCVLEWDALELGTTSLKSLILYKNGTRLTQIQNPLINSTIKLSGLAVDTPFEFYLRLDTTAGIYKSERVQVKTHKMTDLTGITVCLGEINPKENISKYDIELILKKMGAKPIQSQVQVDTTHFVCTIAAGAQCENAVNANIPIVRPEWLKACETEKKIIGVSIFYLDHSDSEIIKRYKIEHTITPTPPRETPATPKKSSPVFNTTETPRSAKDVGEQEKVEDKIDDKEMEDVPLDESVELPKPKQNQQPLSEVPIIESLTKQPTVESGPKSPKKEFKPKLIEKDIKTHETSSTPTITVTSFDHKENDKSKTKENKPAVAQEINEEAEVKDSKVEKLEEKEKEESKTDGFKADEFKADEPKAEEPEPEEPKAEEPKVEEAKPEDLEKKEFENEKEKKIPEETEKPKENTESAEEAKSIKKENDIL